MSTNLAREYNRYPSKRIAYLYIAYNDSFTFWNAIENQSEAGPSGPGPIFVSPKNEILIADYYARRILIYSTNLSLKKIVNTTHRIYRILSYHPQKGFLALGWSADQSTQYLHLFLLDQSGETLFRISPDISALYLREADERLENYHMLWEANLGLLYTPENGFWTIDFNNASSIKIRQEKEAIAHLRELKKDNPKLPDIQIDGKHITVDGHLFTGNFHDYLTWLDKNKGEIQKVGAARELQYNISDLFDQNYQRIGYRNELSYWRLENQVLILSNQGHLLDVFIPIKEDEYSSRPLAPQAADHYGNLFTAEADAGQVALYVTRTPADPRTSEPVELEIKPGIGVFARSMNKGVLIRIDPNIYSHVVASLDSGEWAIVDDRSATREKIGEMNAFWYHVKKIRSNVTGWSYGHFIDLDW